jgi:hypothetical protein
MATQTEIAKHLDLSVRKVRDLMADEIIPKDGSLDECRVAYIRSLREKAAGRGMSGSGDYESEKLRLTKAQADNEEQKARKSELEVKVLEASLIRAEDVDRVWGGMIAAARAKFLAIPSKGASLVLAAESRIEAEDILRGLVYEGLRELAEKRAEDYAGSAEESDREEQGDLAPAAEPDGDGVGRHDAPAKPRRQRRARAVQ